MLKQKRFKSKTTICKLWAIRETIISAHVPAFALKLPMMPIRSFALRFRIPKMGPCRTILEYPQFLTPEMSRMPDFIGRDEFLEVK